MRVRALVVLALTIATACGSNGGTDEGAAPSWTECPAFESGEWSRSPAPIAALEFPVTLATTPNAAVVVSRGSAFVSPDGLDWREAADFPTGPAWGQRVEVAGGAAGFVAVSAAMDGIPQVVAPAVAVSADGSRWEVIDPSSLPDDRVAHLVDVIAGPHGFVVVGRNDGADYELEVWHSSDGREWRHTEFSNARGGTGAFADDARGWIALTTAFPYGEDVAHGGWTSTDGAVWTRFEADPVLDEALYTQIGLAPLVAVDGAHVLIKTEAPPGTSRPLPTVWVSRDRGVTWAEHAVGAEPRFDGFVVHDAAATGDGVAIAGRHLDRSDGDQPFLHTSTDGAAWEHCATAPQEFVAIGPLGSSLVAVDATTSHSYVWRPPEDR